MGILGVTGWQGFFYHLVAQLLVSMEAAFVPLLTTHCLLAARFTGFFAAVCWGHGVQGCYSPLQVLPLNVSSTLMLLCSLIDHPGVHTAEL